jgi:hypothetical protein
MLIEQRYLQGQANGNDGKKEPKYIKNNWFFLH